ncbi:MAG: hypothetical protein SGARI_002517 [Bacillariaceae sp.]
MPSIHPITNRKIRSRLILSAAIVAFFFGNCSVAAFTVGDSRVSGSMILLPSTAQQSISSQSTSSVRPQSRRNIRNDGKLLWHRHAVSSDDSNDNQTQDENTGDSSVEFAGNSQQPGRRKKHSVGRYGGRSRKSNADKPAIATEATKLPWKTTAAAAALLLWIFSGNDNDNDSNNGYTLQFGMEIW